MSESTLRLHVPQQDTPPITLAVHEPGKASKSRKRRKKGKGQPRRSDGCPLFLHATGRWCKKVRGQLVYFGRDLDAALQKWADEKDDLLAGRTPRQKVEGVTLDDAVQHFLHAKQKLVEAGELSPTTWADYAKTCKRMLAHFGRQRLLTDLEADDLGGYRAELAKTRAPQTLAAEIVRTRVVLKHASDCRLIPAPIHLGNAFKKPSAKTIRKARAEKGPRMFEAAELRRVIAAARLPLKCWVLLGVNAGLGNADCARLELRHLDLHGGWLDFPRPKTGIDRRAKLWPETVQALQDWLAVRPKPASKAAAELVFLAHDGAGLYDEAQGKAEAVGRNMLALLRTLGMKGCKNFYALRHTFETIAGESRDQVAVNAVMGHIDTHMSAIYRERISDERLSAVAEHVRGWLFGSTATK